MSKKVKNLIEKQIDADLVGVDGIAVINPRGIGAIKNNLIRRRLHEKGLRNACGQEHPRQARRATARR